MLCKLCGENEAIENSHILPKFFFRWIKETSATGYLRSSETPNKPLQDGLKEPLLCPKCENDFSKLEMYFKETIFTPYVKEYLDDFMREADYNKLFVYNENLLRFLISIQWRILVTDRSNLATGYKEFDSVLKKKIDVWRDYLLLKRNDTGLGQNHILFFRNLIDVRDQLPKGLPRNLNTYLLRASDGTIGRIGKRLIVYSKLGPIAFITSLMPETIKKYKGTIVHKSGVLSCIQKLGDPYINNFFLHHRAQRINDSFDLSKEQTKKIQDKWKNNPERAFTSTTFKVAVTDHTLCEEE